MTIGFLETPRFPEEISAWAVGGRRFNTTIVQTYGGDEYRNAPWQFGLGEWDVQEALRSTNPNSALAYTRLRDFLLNRLGPLGGFRVKFFDDYTDEGKGILGATGLAVASTTVYQMYKQYTLGSSTGIGIIIKPVVGATAVFNNGVLQLLGVNYTIDESTGLVTFLSQPTVGHTLTWTGQFDLPCRLGDDTPHFGLNPGGTFYDWQNLKLIELRNP